MDLPASYSRMADAFTEALSKRARPPHRIPRNTLNTWVKNHYEPNYLALEWIATNAENEQTRKFATDLLDILDELDNRLS